MVERGTPVGERGAAGGRFGLQQREHGERRELDEVFGQRRVRVGARLAQVPQCAAELEDLQRDPGCVQERPEQIARRVLRLLREEGLAEPRLHLAERGAVARGTPLRTRS